MFDWKSLVEQISVKPFDKKGWKNVSGEEIDWSLIPSGFPACQLIDLDKYFNLSEYSPELVAFILRKTEHVGLSLKLEDKMKTPKKRNLRSQSQDYEGPAIDLDNLNETVILQYNYFLGISQTKNLEIYSDIECKNYPYRNFLSYQDCDESFVYNRMRDSKIMPFWASHDMDEVTNFT